MDCMSVLDVINSFEMTSKITNIMKRTTICLTVLDLELLKKLNTLLKSGIIAQNEITHKKRKDASQI